MITGVSTAPRRGSQPVRSARGLRRMAPAHLSSPMETLPDATVRKMSWKEDFHKAVLSYINSRYHVNAIHLLYVYDFATSYENSCGGYDNDYSCDIVYIN